jgi:hypothetical protein
MASVHLSLICLKVRGVSPAAALLAVSLRMASMKSVTVL